MLPIRPAPPQKIKSLIEIVEGKQDQAAQNQSACIQRAANSLR